MAVNGSATKSDLANVELVLNNTVGMTEKSLKKLTGELSKFQTIEQTNYTLTMLLSISRDSHEFNTFIVSFELSFKMKGFYTNLHFIYSFF